MLRTVLADIETSEMKSKETNTQYEFIQQFQKQTIVIFN